MGSGVEHRVYLARDEPEVGRRKTTTHIPFVTKFHLFFCSIDFDRGRCNRALLNIFIRGVTVRPSMEAVQLDRPHDRPQNITDRELHSTRVPTARTYHPELRPVAVVSTLLLQVRRCIHARRLVGHRVRQSLLHSASASCLPTWEIHMPRSFRMITFKRDEAGRLVVEYLQVHFEYTSKMSRSSTTRSWRSLNYTLAKPLRSRPHLLTNTSHRRQYCISNVPYFVITTPIYPSRSVYPIC